MAHEHAAQRELVAIPPVLAMLSQVHCSKHDSTLSSSLGVCSLALFVILMGRICPLFYPYSSFYYSCVAFVSHALLSGSYMRLLCPLAECNRV